MNGRKKKSIPENKSFRNTVIDVYDETDGCHHVGTIEKTVDIQENWGNFKEYKRVENEDVSMVCEYFIDGRYRKYIDRYPMVWRFNKKPISNSHKYMTSSNENTWSDSTDLRIVKSSLTIYALEPEDYGEYQCIYKRLEPYMMDTDD